MPLDIPPSAPLSAGSDKRPLSIRKRAHGFERMQGFVSMPPPARGRRGKLIAAVAAVVVIARVGSKAGSRTKARTAGPNRRTYLIGSDDGQISDHTGPRTRVIGRRCGDTGTCRRGIRTSRPIVTAHI